MYKFKLTRVIISLFTLYCTCIFDNPFLCVNAFSHFVIYNLHVQGTPYVDQRINSTMTCVQHTRRVTRVQHVKSYSRAAHEYHSCAVHEILHVCGPLCVTRQKLKNTRVFSAHKCQLRNELYCWWIIRVESLQSILDNYTALLETWQESLEATKDTEMRARIIGVLSQIITFSFSLVSCLGNCCLVTVTT